MKNSVLLTIAAIIFSLQLIGQETLRDSLFTKAPVIQATVSVNYAQICPVVGYACRCDFKSIDIGRPVIVSGIYQCDLHRPKYFFEIVYRGETWFIEREFLHFKDDTNYFNKISLFSDTEKAVFREKAQLIGQNTYLKQLEQILAFFESCKTKGLVILDWNVYDESEFTEGTSFRIKFFNPTKKIVKYITTSIVGYNPVGDRVYNSTIQSYTSKVKSVGPIKPDSSAEYEFDYVWFTDLVETAKITSIFVQYMDGTTKTIANPDSIRLKRPLYELMQESEIE